MATLKQLNFIKAICNELDLDEPGEDITTRAASRFISKYATKFYVKKTKDNENSEMAVYKQLEAWHEFVRATQTQLGARKADYATKAIFRIFDMDGSVVAEYNIYGVWPKQVPDLQFSGAAQAVPVSIEWSFDYAELAS